MPETLLIQWYPRVLRGLLAAFLLLGLCNVPLLAARLRAAAGARLLAAAGAVFLGALALRLFWVPRVHHVYYDELEHLDIARNAGRSGAWGETLVGGRADFTVLTIPYWPGTHHVLLGEVFRWTGFSERAAFVHNAWLSALTVPLLFAAGLFLLADAGAALLAALLLALSPLHLHYSGATDLTNPSLFWLTAALALLALYEETGALRVYLQFAAAALLAVHSRPENLLLAPFLAAYLLLGPRRFKPAALAAHLPALVLLWPLAYLAWRNRSLGLTGYADDLAGHLSHLAAFLPRNLSFLLRPAALHGLLPPFASLGAFLLWRGRRRSVALLLGLALAFLLFYSSFAAGDFSAGIFGKYGMAVHLPILLLAAYGLRRACAGLSRPLPAAAAAAALCLLPAWPAYSGQGSFYSPDVRLRDRFLREAGARLPNGPFIISHSAAAVNVVLDRPSAAAAYLLERPDLFEDEDLILFQDFWWYEKKPVSERLEARLRQDYDLSTLEQTEIGGLRYAFHRLRRRKPR